MTNSEQPVRPLERNDKPSKIEKNKSANKIRERKLDELNYQRATDEGMPEPPEK